MGQYFEELIVRQEVKPGEFGSLRFQIIVQRFLNHIQGVVVISDFLEQLFDMTDRLHIDNLTGLVDDHAPEVVSSLEVLALLVELLSDVWRVKYRLQIHPIYLELGPLLHYV